MERELGPEAEVLPSRNIAIHYRMTSQLSDSEAKGLTNRQ